MQRIIAFIILLGAVVCPLCPTTVEADDTVTIGVLTDLSGPGVYYGQQTRVGAALAEQELLGLGKKVKIIFEDSALKTQQGLSAIQKLVQLDGIDGAYVDFTPIVTAVSPFMRSHRKLLVFAAAATSPLESNPFAFKTYSDYEAGCAALASEFKKRGVQKFGVLKAEAEFGELCERGVKKFYPEYTLRTYKPGEPQAAQMLAMKSAGVEAIANASFEPDLIETLLSAGKIRYKVSVGSARDTFTAALTERFSSQLDGSLAFGLSQPPEPLITKFRAIPGGVKLSSYEGAGFGYLHVKQMFFALEACRGQVPACAVNHLAAAGPDSVMNFTGWSNRIAQLKTTIEEFKDGAFHHRSSY